jgi:hypothetical protein
VRDATGITLASGTGTGPDVDWTWDASALVPGSYSYAIRAGSDVTPAEGVIGGGEVSLAIAGLAADPETVSPNADTIADLTTLTFMLNADANVGVVVRDALGNAVVEVPRRWRRAGEIAIRLDPAPLPDGIYRVDLTANATGGRVATASTQLAVTRTLGRVAASRVSFSPDADGRADRIAFRFALAAPAEVRVRVLRDGKWVATPFRGPLEAGQRTVEWDGAKRVGRLLDGVYEAVVEATDPIATSSVTLPFSSDTRDPKLRIVQRNPLKVWVSEPALLQLRFGTRTVKREATAAGTLTIPKLPRLGVVRVVAWDPAGNKSIPKSKR